MKVRPVKVYLDEELIAWVKAEAARRHCTMTQVYRDLIIKAMEETDELG